LATPDFRKSGRFISAFLSPVAAVSDLRFYSRLCWLNKMQIVWSNSLAAPLTMTKTVATLAACFLYCSLALAQSDSGSAVESDFASKARELAKQERLKVEPQVFTPASSRPGPKPWHTNMVTTVFWVGEGGNERSVWDPHWKNHYGGTDDPDPAKRRDFIPVSFVPQLNPFYCALPYNDIVHEQFRPEAALVIPWFKQFYTEPGKPERVCYAQWSDCGPFVTDHFQYVFGDERPRPNANHGAGLNVSPAVRDYLGLSSTDITDWQFVEIRNIPPGPWRSFGRNNHFVLARDLQHRLIDKMRPADLDSVAF
jgi:hypothetical protein